MITTFEPHVQHTHQLPSIQKYGTIIAEDGFTQHPRAVEDYLNSLDICSTAILLIIILSSYRWEAEKEFYPSVKKLAERCGVTTRRINQLTALLCELGLLIKTERFAGRSQLSNYYDLEPLFEKVAAWKSAKVAEEMAEEESQADEPFEPQSILEQSAQIISQEFGEQEPRQQRYNARRLERRCKQNQHLSWDNFVDIIEKSMKQTQDRREEPTRTGRTFEKLIPYFFSALDYRLLRAQPATTLAQLPQQPQASQPRQADQSQQKKGPQQPAKKSGLLAERAAARKAAESAGQRKVRPPETLALHIGAASLTFNDDQEKSSVQRAANIMADAEIDELTMLNLVASAREAASRSTKIMKKNKYGKINRMPYFFTILEEKVQSIIESKNSVHQNDALFGASFWCMTDSFHTYR